MALSALAAVAPGVAAAPAPAPRAAAACGTRVDIGVTVYDRPHGVVKGSGSYTSQSCLGSQASGGLLLSLAPGILGSLAADLRGRGVEPAVVGRVLAGPAGRIGVRAAALAMSTRLP